MQSATPLQATLLGAGAGAGMGRATETDAADPLFGDAPVALDPPVALDAPDPPVALDAPVAPVAASASTGLADLTFPEATPAPDVVTGASAAVTGASAVVTSASAVVTSASAAVTSASAAPATRIPLSRPEPAAAPDPEPGPTSEPENQPRPQPPVDSPRPSSPRIVRAVPIPGSGAVMPGAARRRGYRRPTAAEVEAQLSPHAGGIYRVRPGDSLWDIAQGLLGDRATAASVYALAQRVWAENREAVDSTDANRLKVGTVLHLPEEVG